MRRTVKLNLLERLPQKVQMVDYGSHITQNCIKNVTKNAYKKQFHSLPENAEVLNHVPREVQQQAVFVSLQ